MDFQRGMAQSSKFTDRSPVGQHYIGGDCTSSCGRESPADTMTINDSINKVTLGNSMSPTADVLAIPPMILDAAFPHEFIQGDFFNDFALNNH